MPPRLESDRFLLAKLKPPQETLAILSLTEILDEVPREISSARTDNERRETGEIEGEKVEERGCVWKEGEEETLKRELPQMKDRGRAEEG